MHLSNCSKVKLVSYHQFLRVTNSIPWCFLGWNSILRNLSFLACIENTQIIRLWVKKPFFQKYFKNSGQVQHFKVRVANFEPLYLRLLWVKIQSFCALDWKFPEFFKTHPTFICTSFLKASRSLWTLTSVFFGTPCMYLDVLLSSLTLIISMP